MIYQLRLLTRVRMLWVCVDLLRFIAFSLFLVFGRVSSVSCSCRHVWLAMVYCSGGAIVVVWWLRLGVVVITTAQLHSTKSKVRFCAGSNPVGGVLEIRVSEDIWQWSRLEIKLNAFDRWTIPQKQFIIIIIIIIIKIGCMSLDAPSNYCVNVLKFRVRDHGCHVL